MKKPALILLLLLIFNAYFLTAAAIYENVNQSAEFIRTLNRNASTDVDAAFFNPAGLVFMKQNGLFLSFTDQFITQKSTVKESNSMSTVYMTGGAPYSFEGTARAYVFPTLHIVYKKDDLAYFFSIMPIEGGSYANGIGMPDIQKMAIFYAFEILQKIPDPLQPNGYKADAKITGGEFAIGPTIGGAYALNKNVSIGLGIRFIYEYGKSNIDLTYTQLTGASNNNHANDPAFSPTKFTSTATGTAWGFLASMHLMPVEELHIGLRWEYYTHLTMEQDVQKSGALVSFLPNDGDTSKKTFPMVFAVGISYQFLPKLKIEPDLTYFFNKAANWDGQVNPATGTKQNYNNGYDIGIAIEYDVLSQLKASVGYSYSVSGITSESRNNTRPGLDYHSIAGGLTYRFSESFSLTLAGLYVMSKSETIALPVSQGGGTQKISDSTWNIAFGLRYKLY